MPVLPAPGTYSGITPGGNPSVGLNSKLSPSALQRIVDTINPLASTEEGVVKDSESWESALGKLAQALGNRNTWLRVAEGVLGIALILVGVSKLAEGTPIASAIKKVPLI
jgi:hypothetical protein